MKKFDLVKFTDEWKALDAEKYRPGDAAIDGEKERLAAFDTEAEAVEALKGYQNHYTLRPGAAGSFFAVEEFMVEENEYDGAGEFVSGGDILDIADTSEWNVSLNHDWLRKNKFRIDCARFDGVRFGEWMPLVNASDDWFDDVADFLRTLDRNGYFNDNKTADDAATRDKCYYKIVATYSCNDADEDYPLSWGDVSEILEN